MPDRETRDRDDDAPTGDATNTDRPDDDGVAAEPPPGEPLAIEAPDASPNDERIRIRITGADPGEQVTFAASLVDHDGVEWHSRATFTADARGVVDLTEQAPVDGTYEGVEPMGWLWSMEADTDVRGAALTARPRVTVDLVATPRDRHGNPDLDRRTERTVTRRLYDDGVTREVVDHEDLAGVVFEPPGEGPHPGVLCLHGSGGQLPVRAAQLLATRGYAVFAVRYFGDPDPVPDEHRRVPLSYFGRAADWFRDRPAVRDGQLGAMGGSRGGELALLLGSRFAWVGAVVSLAGSGVAWDSPSGEPGWVEDGEAVPHLEGKPIPRETVANGLADEPVAEATIPVEETDGPVLLVSGGDDQLWPARQLSAFAVDRLERGEFPHPFEHLTFDDAGHLISLPYAPLGEFDVGGGTPRGTAHAAEDAWPAIRRYLATGLGVTDDGERSVEGRR